jgi:hypothetical protein
VTRPPQAPTAEPQMSDEEFAMLRTAIAGVAAAANDLIAQLHATAAQEEDR